MKEISVLVDELGHNAVIKVDLTLYSLTAVFKTVYWQTEHLYLFLSRGEENDEIRIEVRLKDIKESKINLEHACLELCNSLIDFETRQRVISETKSIRDTLVAKAFAEGAHHSNLEYLS